MRATGLNLLVALTATISARASGQQAVPTTDLNFRSGPGRTYQVLAVVGPTDTLTLLSLTRRNHYYNVQTADGNQGWVWDGGITLSAAESGAEAASLDSLPTWDKPEPVESSSGTCSPYGKGAIVDSATDLLKNRVDTATVYHAVPFATVLALPWQGLPTRRFNWSASDSTSVARYEGVPIAVEGYLGGSREEGKEATNCGIDTHAWHDWHLWLVETADAG